MNHITICEKCVIMKFGLLSIYINPELRFKDTIDCQICKVIGSNHYVIPVKNDGTSLFDTITKHFTKLHNSRRIAPKDFCVIEEHYVIPVKNDGTSLFDTITKHFTKLHNSRSIAPEDFCVIEEYRYNNIHYRYVARIDCSVEIQRFDLKLAMWTKIKDIPSVNIDLRQIEKPAKSFDKFNTIIEE